MSDNPLTVVPPENPGQQGEHDLIRQAHDKIHAGDRSGALDLVVRALDINPNNLSALYMYAQLTPDRDAAVHALNKVLSTQPSHTEARLLLERLQADPEAKPSSFSSFPAAPSPAPPPATLVHVEAPSPPARVEPPPVPVRVEPPPVPQQYQPPLPVRVEPPPLPARIDPPPLPQQYQPPPAQPSPGPDSNQLAQQMLMQHHMLMQQQMVSHHQISQQQILSNQQIAQQQLLAQQRRGPGVGLTVIGQNDTAFWLGLIMALIGLFGVSYAVNNRAGSGIGYAFLGFVWDAIVVGGAYFLHPATLFVAAPLHIFFAYQNAKFGARWWGVIQSG
jgi:hypothetical protein